MSIAKRKVLLTLAVINFIVGVICVSYGVTMYADMGSNNQLIVGEIYMNYTEGQELIIQNATPRSSYDSNNYFEFNIQGKNTNTLYDINYELILVRGTVPSGSLEANRIADNFLKFRLTEQKDNNSEVVVFDNRSYSDLSSGQEIHTDEISKNQLTETVHRYKLYFWIDNSLLIGKQGIPNIDYTEEEWALAFASIRVNVSGNFDTQ